MSHDTVDPHLHNHPFVGKLALLEAFFWITCYGLFCAFHVAVHGTLQGICIGIASMSSILVLTMFAKKDPNDFWLLLSVVLFALSWGILISVSGLLWSDRTHFPDAPSGFQAFAWLFSLMLKYVQAWAVLSVLCLGVTCLSRSKNRLRSVLICASVPGVAAFFFCICGWGLT